jgi:hypothetical protein
MRRTTMTGGAAARIWARQAKAGIECPQCPLAREKSIAQGRTVLCTAVYHDGGIPMKYPKGKP